MIRKVLFLLMGLLGLALLIFIGLYPYYALTKNDSNADKKESRSRVKLPFDLPISGSYYVWCACGKYPKKNTNLIEKDSPGSRGRDIILPIKKYNLANNRIIGTTPKGYFIFDISTIEAEPEVFPSKEKWLAALGEAGIRGDISLLDPYKEAARRPDIEIRPWEYVKLHGLLGGTDKELGYLIIFLGFVISFMYGAFTRRNQWWTCYLFGLVSCVIGGILFGGGVLGFGAVFVWPFFCMYAGGWIGRVVQDGIMFVVKAMAKVIPAGKSESSE